MVRHDYALDFPKSKYSDGFALGLRNEAKAAKRGTWAGSFDRPWEWRKQMTVRLPRKRYTNPSLTLLLMLMADPNPPKAGAFPQRPPPNGRRPSSREGLRVTCCWPAGPEATVDALASASA
jgi:hypothetical protein